MKNSEQVMGQAIYNMLLHAKTYAEAYKQHFENDLGNDYVLGEYMKEILHGLYGLLDGPLGRLAGGDLSREIYQAAEHMKLLDKNGEI
jgi:hypothetical protein